MSAPAKLVKIGEFARIGDTNLRTLRYYEELGLLAPASRTTGGIRYYRQSDVHRLHMIGELQCLGLSLEQIRDLLVQRRVPEEREEFIKTVKAALRQQDELLAKRIEVLEGQRAKIRAALHKLGECEHCQHTPSAQNNFCDPCGITGNALPESLSALF